MAQLFGLILLSAFITGVLLIPFVDFLYKIKLQRARQQTKDPFNQRTPIFDKYNSWKVGTPFGGGLLIIIVVSVLTMWAYGMFGIEVNYWKTFVLLFSFISFGLLGLYDDFKKLVDEKNKSFFGLRFRHKFAIQWVLAFIVATILSTQFDYSFVNVRGFGLITLGYLYIPFAAFVIVAFANAFNITDGLDGLASGVLLICLVAFLVLAASSPNLSEELAIFIAILLGSVAAFLYFNIHPARIWLGDVGSMSLGASLAVIGLLTDKTLALAVIGGVFVLEVGSSLIQLLSKKFLGRKILPASPLHLLLQRHGWEEPKIVMRAWLLAAIFAVFGLYLAFISR